MGILEREALEEHLASYEEGYTAGFRAGRREVPIAERTAFIREHKRPKKRRKTAYQGAYSAAYKRLKKKHPRMAFGSLSKKAHAAARKKVKR